MPKLLKRIIKFCFPSFSYVYGLGLSFGEVFVVGLLCESDYQLHKQILSFFINILYSSLILFGDTILSVKAFFFNMLS